MGKTNIGKILASFAGCFFMTVISFSGHNQILPDVSPSLQVLENLFSLNLSEPALLVLSGIGLIGIGSIARERLKN